MNIQATCFVCIIRSLFVQIDYHPTYPICWLSQVRFELNCSLEKWADCVTRLFSLWNAEQLNSHRVVLHNLHGLGLHSLCSTWQSGWSTQQRLGFECLRGWGWPWNCGLWAHNPKPHQRGNLSPVATQLPSLTRLISLSIPDDKHTQIVILWRVERSAGSMFCLDILLWVRCGPNCSTKKKNWNLLFIINTPDQGK